MKQNYVCDAQTRLDKYFNSIPEKDYLSTNNWAIISNYVANPHSAVFNNLLNREDDFKRIYGDKAVNIVIHRILADAWSGSIESTAFKKAELYIRSLSHPLAKLLISQSDYLRPGKSALNTLLQQPDKADKYIQEYDKYVTKYDYLFNIYAVNEAANSIMDQLKDNTAYISKAKNWMKLLLALPGNEDYDFFATYAKACFLTNDYKNAVQAQEKAIALAIKEELNENEMRMYEKQLDIYKRALSIQQ